MTAVPTVGEFIEGPWRATEFSRFKRSTRVRTEKELRRQLLPTFGDIRLDELDRGAVQAWFDDYGRSAPAGANRARDTLHQIMATAVEHGWVERNPVTGIKHWHRPRRTRYLSHVELGLLHRALDEHRPRTDSGRQQVEIIRLLLLTGCRRGEIVHLRWDEVHGDTLRLRDAKTGPRSVVLNRPAQALLARQPRVEGSPWVWPDPGDLARSRPADPSRPRTLELSVWKQLQRRVDLGIRDVRLHDLRHTHASHAVMQGVPIPVVSRLLGHRQPRMTMRYAHVGDRETEAAAERIGVRIAELIGLTVPPGVEGERCLDCDAPLSRNSSGGRCNPCSSQEAVRLRERDAILRDPLTDHEQDILVRLREQAAAGREVRP